MTRINASVAAIPHQLTMSDPSLLLTDLYELSMLEAYAAHGMTDTAVFEVFVRKLPSGRGFLMAAGLEQAVQFLETMRFTPDDIAWLRASRRFAPAFLDELAGLRFTGDVDALREGTVFFPDEPLLRVTAAQRCAIDELASHLGVSSFGFMLGSSGSGLDGPGWLTLDLAHGILAGLAEAASVVTARPSRSSGGGLD